MLQLPVFVMLADQFTACNQAPLASRLSLPSLSLDLPQKATAEDRLNGREFVKKKREGDEEKKWPSRNVVMLCGHGRSRFFLIWIRNGP